MMSRREREDVLVRRTVTVETIPSGQPYALHEGKLAQITQALGGCAASWCASKALMPMRLAKNRHKA